MTIQRFTYPVEYTSNLDSRHGTLFTGINVRFDLAALRRFFGRDLRPRLVDLLRISMAIYVVDRLVGRGRGPSEWWRRDIRVRVAVFDPDFWTVPGVLDSLQEVAQFVSGDDWDFELFGSKIRHEWTRPLLADASANERPLVCLYSGGLDSAAGLALRLKECTDRRVLPVTVWHQPRQNKLIKTQLDMMRHRLGATIEPLVLKATMIRQAESNWSDQEHSQRARSFLFAVAGAVAAAVAGGSTVEVFESGIGAINVPLMAGMVGSMATRGSHPEFLRRMSGLCSLVAGREIAFRLPFFGRTKGEMVRDLKEAGLSDLARATISCARYPVGHYPYTPCGICPACLFRRQAMQAAGVEESQGTYSFDLFGTAEEVNRIPSDKLDYLKAFLMQVAEWAEIETHGRLPEPLERHLRHTRVLKPGESPEALISLLARYRDEWMAIAATGRQQGYQWAGLLAPARSHIEQGACYAPA